MTKYAFLLCLLAGCDMDKMFPSVVSQVGQPETEEWVFTTYRSSKHGSVTFQTPRGTVRVLTRHCHPKVEKGTIIPVTLVTQKWSDGVTRVSHGSDYNLSKRVCR